MGKSCGRILFIVSQPYFEWRGSPIRVGFDVQALAELGYEVDLLLPPIGADRPVPGVTIHRVRRIPGIRNLPIGPSVAKLLFDVLLYLRARKLMRLHRYAVLHGVEDAGAVCALLAIGSNARLVFEKHSDPSSYKKGFIRALMMSAYAAVERWVIRRADAVIGTGPELAAYASKVDPETYVRAISDIPSSLRESTVAEATAARERFALDAEECLITYVGSFAVYQGIDLLFASIPLVCRSNAKARFIIIGGSPDEIAAREQDLRAAGVLNHVTFAGKIAPDTLPAVLAGSDILLSPRISGTNTPLKLLDYLKAGRAIVATDNPANRQILDESTAVFADSHPESLAAAILRLLDDAALRERLGAGGGALVARKHNFVCFQSALAKLYAHILQDACLVL